MFHMYGLFIGIAVVVGYSVAEKMEPKVSKVAPWVLGFGFVGARIWHVIDMWSYYSLNLSQIVAVWNGGLGIWGGIIGGFAAYQFTIYNLQFTKNEQWSTLGAMVTGLPLAQAIGRLGNAVNGEFYDKVWILPWWGAEVILDLCLFGTIFYVSSRAKSRDPSTTVGMTGKSVGMTGKSVGMTSVYIYLVGYFLIRLILNPFRADLR